MCYVDPKLKCKELIVICDILAGFIARTMQLNCGDCISDMLDDTGKEKRSLIQVKDRGGLVTPSDRAFSVCQVAEGCLRLAIQTHGLHKNTPCQVLAASLQKVLDLRIHRSFQCPIHATTLTRDIIKRYLCIRIHYETKKAMTTDTTVWSRLNRLVIFSHI